MITALFHGRRHFAIVAWLVFAVSLLKGLRMPSSWSATHMTFNYSHGFIRRGLIGEVLRLVGGARPYNNYGHFLFDGYSVQGYPFEGPVKSLIDLFKGHFTFLPRD
jgi:hypothetical protein